MTPRRPIDHFFNGASGDTVSLDDFGDRCFCSMSLSDGYDFFIREFSLGASHATRMSPMSPTVIDIVLYRTPRKVGRAIVRSRPIEMACDISIRSLPDKGYEHERMDSETAGLAVDAEIDGQIPVLGELLSEQATSFGITISAREPYDIAMIGDRVMLPVGLQGDGAPFNFVHGFLRDRQSYSAPIAAIGQEV